MMTHEMTVRPIDKNEDLSQSHQFTVSGLDNYWLSEHLYEVHDIEGEKAYSYPQFENVCAVIGTHLCSLERHLGPREVRFMRTQMEMSQVELSAKLGYTDDQIIGRAESMASKRYAPLQKAEDTLLRMFYLSHLQTHKDVADYLRETARQTSHELDAQRLLETVDVDDLLIA